MKTLDELRMDRIAVGIGMFIRHFSGAVAFAYWQGSIAAGICAFVLLMTLEQPQ